MTTVGAKSFSKSVACLPAPRALQYSAVSVHRLRVQRRLHRPPLLRLPPRARGHLFTSWSAIFSTATPAGAQTIPDVGTEVRKRLRREPVDHTGLSQAIRSVRAHLPLTTPSSTRAM